MFNPLGARLQASHPAAYQPNTKPYAGNYKQSADENIAIHRIRAENSADPLPRKLLLFEGVFELSDTGNPQFDDPQ